MAKLPFPLQFKRQYAGSLDADHTFTTTAERMAYLSSALCYPGQPVFDEETGKPYWVNGDKSDYLGLSDIDEESLTATQELAVHAEEGNPRVGLLAWLRGLDVTPELFGAVGDGATLDTTALQSAITFCRISGLGLRGVPGKTYLVDQTLSFWNSIQQYPIRFRDAVIKQADGANLSELTIVDGIPQKSFQEVELCVNGNQENNTTEVIGVSFVDIAATSVYARAEYCHKGVQITYNSEASRFDLCLVGNRIGVYLETINGQTPDEIFIGITGKLNGDLIVIDSTDSQITAVVEIFAEHTNYWTAKLYGSGEVMFRGLSRGTGYFSGGGGVYSEGLYRLMFDNFWMFGKKETDPISKGLHVVNGHSIVGTLYLQTFYQSVLIDGLSSYASLLLNAKQSAGSITPVTLGVEGNSAVNSFNLLEGTSIRPTEDILPLHIVNANSCNINFSYFVSGLHDTLVQIESSSNSINLILPESARFSQIVDNSNQYNTYEIVGSLTKSRMNAIPNPPEGLAIRSIRDESGFPARYVNGEWLIGSTTAPKYRAATSPNPTLSHGEYDNHANWHALFTKANSKNVTYNIPVQDGSESSIPLGIPLTMVQYGDAFIELTPAPGVTIRSSIGLSTRYKYDSITIVQEDINVWVVLAITTKQINNPLHFSVSDTANDSDEVTLEGPRTFDRIVTSGTIGSYSFLVKKDSDTMFTTLSTVAELNAWINDSANVSTLVALYQIKLSAAFPSAGNGSATLF